MNRYSIYLLALVVLLSDQLTKHWVSQSFHNWPCYDYVYSKPVIKGLFSLTYVQNTGGAFGVFHSVHSGTIALACISALAAVAIVTFTLRSRSPFNCIVGIALGAALGGAVGNFIDRVRLGYVVDFLDFHIGTHQWPVFNVADSAICIGVGLLAFYYGSAPGKTASAPVTEN